MSGRIPQDFINDLLEKVDVSEIVGARVELKRAGREYKGLCPFHGEKTPSFHVVPEKGFYHCFGCGAHGTALTFLLEHDRLEFVQAVETLAAAAGVEVPREQTNVRRDDRRTRLLDVVDRADRWFRQQLRSHPERARAVDYLRARGVSGEIARTFGIGYAPPGYENLFAGLGSDPALRPLLVEAGLLAEREDGTTYDRFRDRILFPIRDGRGRTIAFGGRVLGDGQPKYLNSPESPLFHKGRELYGLWECRRAVRDPQRVLLVEGYMDVVGLAQAGIAEVCASLGTAATRDHLEKLFRLAPEVVFCFDGDAAGRRAALKATHTALDVLEDGVSVRLLFLPEGEDPDSLVRREGPEAFRERLGASRPLSEYLFEELSAELDLGVLDDRSRLVHRARPLIERIPGPMLRALMLRRLADLAELPVETVTGPASSRPSTVPSADRFEESPPEAPSPRGQTMREGTRRRVRWSKEQLAVALLLRRPDLADRVDDDRAEALRQIEGADAALLRSLIARLHEAPGLSTAALIAEQLGTEDHARLIALARRELQLERAALEREFDDTLERLAEGARRAGRARLMERIRSGEASEDELQRYLALKRADAGVPEGLAGAGARGPGAGSDH
ncbi:MAG: DNA primase [Pseudomonadales bacterium]|jgi:DNA primase|nr:DNA primase [Pseudomonadales bacterium]